MTASVSLRKYLPKYIIINTACCQLRISIFLKGSVKNKLIGIISAADVKSNINEGVMLFDSENRPCNRKL